MPAEHSARGLVDEFPLSRGAGTVLFPSADGAPATIADGSGSEGMGRWSAWRPTARCPGPRPSPRCSTGVAAADALTFTATSSLEAYLALRSADGRPVPVPPHVVCIGPTTAAAARAAGLAGVHEAWGASAEGIVAELVDHFGQQAGDGS